MSHSATACSTAPVYRPPHRDVDRAAVLVDAGIIKQADACDHKAAFTSRNEAKGAAKAVMRRTGRRATVYKCPWADHYHVTKLKHGEGESENEGDE